MNPRPLLLVSAALLAAVHAADARAGALPIYVEDNHAGTFYWLAQNVDLEQPCTLVLFDAHSDASGIFDSDKIRDALRNVASNDARQELLEHWRSKGTVQCFNWIEPLMPAPIEKVIWVPAAKLSASKTREYRDQATALLDGHLEASPRRAGSLRNTYVVSDFKNLEKHLDANRPLILTIDVDYFAKLPPAQQEADFARIWDFVIERPNLRAITFAVSRPYLQSDNDSQRLLELALTSALSLPTAQIEFEPFLTVANDDSELAKKLMLRGQKPASFNIAQASQELRARILSERQRISVAHDADRWQQLLATWKNEAPELHLQIKDHDPSTDDVWRIAADESADVELVVEPWTTKAHKIEWFALIPKYARCNLTRLSTDQVGFVANAVPWPAWKEITINHHDSLLPIDKIDHFFDRNLHCGSLRLRARAVVDGKIRETPVLELRRFVGTGFRAAVSEQFGLPYLFGSGELSKISDTGPETNLGADCANFVIYALRRQGQRIPWSDPKRLREHLDLMAQSAKPGVAKISGEDLQRGTIVHLDTHVAAVMEDREPFGVLDENDLVAHQLGGTPEILTLGQLLKQRRKNSFDLYRAPLPKTAATLIFGGDVMLGRSCADKIQNGSDPFANVAAVLHSASFAAANLECTISNLGKSEHRYAFRAPMRSAELLRRAGFHVLGLANNHALDFGIEALHDCAALLSREQMQPIGIETPSANAYAARFFSVAENKKIALLAISDVGPAAGPEIAAASDRVRLSQAVANARSRANLVVCMVHWGIENTKNVTDEQRELARWLVDHGVDLVVGSHPHCVQPLDFYHGHPIAYSLGNLVFDGAPTIASWNQAALFEIGLSSKAEVLSARLLPIVLHDGFPQIETAAARNSLSSR